ncbi:hypothetical protein BOW53_04670 [Solemya pervernicosa gill symbiont]|uniref:histidine kinase n=1 Tax=Solemya pervernicosa gill symbiont TaxID=642797 RepID=A0A1T2L8K3_9GAMM|nr:PAS domain S-box protein [Solemya pervernicosa gill symbiont]OOZ41276.1 hypothetical protein BOW53_04670 [Solemya pervernicosa gill symbiont]
MASKEIGFGRVFFEPLTGEPILNMIVPQIDLRSGEVHSAFVAELRLKGLWGEILAESKGEQNIVYLLDQDNRVLAHPNPSVVLRETYFDIEHESGVGRGINGVNAVLTAEPINIGATHFHIVNEIAFDEAMRPAIRTVAVVVAIIVVTLVIALYMAFYGLRSIFTPIERLTVTAREIRGGDLYATAEVGSHDELGELAAAFNGMTRDLRETLEELNGEIIERESRELALEKSERYNRTLFEETPIGLALATMDGQLVDVNEAYAKIIGRSVDEVMKINYMDITPVEYMDQEKQQFACLEQSGRYGPYEKEYIHADGHRVPVLLNGLIIEDDDQRYIWSTVEDITQRKRAEHALTSSEADQRAILENMSDTFIRTDLNGVVERVSQAIIDLLGYEVEEVVGRETSGFYVDPGDRTRMLEKLRKEGVVHDFEMQFQRKDEKKVWVSLNLQRRTNEQGEVIGMEGMLRDITLRKAMEQALRDSHDELERRVDLRTEQLQQAKNEAEQANRAKSEFLSRMSHELRTPMNAVLGFAQLLEVDEELGEDQRDSIQEILMAGNHLLELINEVLDIARIESGRFALSCEEVNLQVLFEECRKLMQPLVEQKSLSLGCNVTVCEEFKFYGDYTRIKQVVLNLLSNAAKYNRENGSIELSCGLIEDRVRISVTDSGIGIAEGHQSEMFEAFNRLGQEGSQIEGSGIGLMISDNLAQAMGGSLGFVSREGEGSTFWIELPISGLPTT